MLEILDATENTISRNSPVKKEALALCSKYNDFDVSSQSSGDKYSGVANV